jgi:hypothetical protein
MSAIININFSSLKGTKFTGQLKTGYTEEDIRKIVASKLGPGRYRLVVNGKEIQENNPQQFAELRTQIKNNTTIYVCQRMDGGSCELIDAQTHTATILADLQNELPKMKKQQIPVDCMICLEKRFCINFCCGNALCEECFSNYFVHHEFKIKCLKSKCNKVIPPEKLFLSDAFVMSLRQLEETSMMTQNIDFQICTCGSFSINSTMYAKQHCNYCKRWMCFFCNEDWDEVEKKMQNTRYTCKVNCYWETKLTYQLVPLEFNKEIQVPNRRCCPKCKSAGAYDRRCKYHTCTCGYIFCFICLKPKADCTRDFKSAYNRPCASIAKQTYDIFPRIGH